MAQSRIIDYSYEMDHVLWWYEVHETKEVIHVYDSTLSFMKKLIPHIPNENFKMIRYIGGYATKKKKLSKMIKKMVSSSQLGKMKDDLRYRQFISIQQA